MAILFRKPNRTLVLVCLLCLFSAYIPLQVLNYGIDSPEAMAAYLNGNFPDELNKSYSWVKEESFGISNVITVRRVPGTSTYAFGSYNGQIHFVDLSQPNPTVELWGDLAPNYNFPNSRYGLKGIAFHPEFGQANSPNSNYVYISYLSLETTSRLSRFSVVASGNRLNLSSELVMIDQLVPGGSFHSIGEIEFGNDGFLYVPLGDAHGGGFGPYAGTNISTNIMNYVQPIEDNLIGGLLRIDVDKDPSKSHAPRKFLPAGLPEGTSGQGYWIPNDNPWLDTGGTIMEEYFSLGHRNPWKLSIDPQTGLPWLAEVGPHNGEEINRIEKGHNYGWPYLVGETGEIVWDRTPPTDPAPSTYRGTLTDPVFSPLRSESRSIIMGCVYRGSKHPELDGWAIVGSVSPFNNWAVRYDPHNGNSQVIELPALASTYYAIFQGPGEEIYAMAKNGDLWELKANPNTSIDPPQLLSQTGAFSNLNTLTPSPGIVPYTINAPLWSDGATKKRWVALPNDGTHNTANEKIDFSLHGTWLFPNGAVFIKHFEMPLDENDPSQIQRLETRFIIRDKNGDAYGLTYKWNEAGTDAVLLNSGESMDYTITLSNGNQETRSWDFPSRSECLTCHNENAGAILGLKTHQLNKEMEYPSGIIDNQLRTLNHLGWFSPGLDEAAISTFPASKNIHDASASPEERVRSYLDANCAHCHMPNGVDANFDARLSTPLIAQGLVDGTLTGAYGIPDAAVVKPQHANQSILYIRDNSVAEDKMPPLAKNIVDEDYIEVLAEWIGNLTPPSKPGGVNANLQLWLKADEGIINGAGVSDWFDFSGKGNHAQQATQNLQPQLLPDAANFNAGLRFEYSDLLTGTKALLNGDQTHSFFLVTKDINSTGNFPDIFRYSATGARIEFRPGGAIGIAGGGGASTPIIDVDKPTLFSLLGNANTDMGFGNGTQGTSRTSSAIVSNGPYQLGRSNFNADIMEVIAYGDNVNQIEREKIESYLAIKYGISLGHTYYASDYVGTGNDTQGNPIWDSNNGYHHDVAGIGRDDRSGLDQRQSKSVNDADILALYHGSFSNSFPSTNASNTQAFPTNKQFLLWGHNQGNTNSLARSIYSGSSNGINRVWKVAEAGNIGEVTIRIAKNDLPADVTSIYINRDNNTNFPLDVTTRGFMLEDGGSHYYVHLDLEDGDIFSFGDGIPMSGLSINIKAFLEGPYNASNGMMNSNLRDEISITDPYGGTASLNPQLLLNEGPTAIVDWILVDFRSTPTQSVATYPLLLRRDGLVVMSDGEATLFFEGLTDNSYYVAIHHYNHLSIMTASAIDFGQISLLDLGNTATALYSDGGQTSTVINNVQLLIAGDASSDNSVNALDKNEFWRAQNGAPYIYGPGSGDFNLDGSVNAIDKNTYWRMNNSKVSQVP